MKLKNELKLANKILLHELGDNFISLQNYATNGANWRGRAQQIISLQQKNSELLERISVVAGDRGTTKVQGFYWEPMGSNMIFVSQIKTTEGRHTVFSKLLPRYR